MEPLAVTHCTLGAIELSTCLQLVLFSNLFWSDIWQDDVSWKQIDMDYLGTPTNKQLKLGTIARLSSRVENPISRLVYGYLIS